MLSTVVDATAVSATSGHRLALAVSNYRIYSLVKVFPDKFLLQHAQKTCQKRSILAFLIIQYPFQKPDIKWSI